MLELNDAHKRTLLSIALICVTMGRACSVFDMVSLGEASTFVEGTISENTTWTLSKSPYVVSQDVEIAGGTILTIEPGVEVRFEGNRSLTVNGSLHAVGTNDSYITFTSNRLTQRPGDWETIKFAGSNNESLSIENCIIEYAEQAIAVESSAKAIIKYSKIMNNSVSGIHVVGESNLNVKGNTIRSNENGISSAGDASSGIKVLDNRFDSNYNGVLLYASSTGTTEISNITIRGNTFSHNENAIKFNMFPITLGEIHDVTISQNTVCLNKNGVYMRIWGGFIDFATNLICDTSISENTVYSNEKYGIYVNCSGPWLGTIFHVSISNNRILSNGAGIHLFANTHYPHVEFDVVISNNTVSANVDRGISVCGGAFREPEEGIRTNITYNSISYNAHGAFYEGDTDNIAHFNDVYNNTYGIYLSDGATVNATHNYWGDPTGPYHEVLNGAGEGNAIVGDEGDVIFTPFLISPVVNSLPIAVLEASETVVTTDQIITFNASESNDDSHITGYFFDFGDGTDSGWITQAVAEHAYASTGRYNVSLKVLDDLGFESDNTALIIIKVQPTLVPFVDVDSEAVGSDGNLTVTIQVTDGSESIANVNVTLSSDMGGVFSPEAGQTDSTGCFVSIFTAPAVTEETVVTITAKAAKTEYQSGEDQIAVNVLPKSVPIDIGYVWILVTIAGIVVIIASAFKIKRHRRG